MQIFITTASKEDIATLAEFQVKMADESEALILDKDTVEKGISTFLERPDYGNYYIAESQDTSEIIGCIMVTKEWSDWNNAEYWWLQSVYVKPEFRHQGVFTKMVEWLEQKARENGVKALRLYVDRTNETAKNCYTRLGLNECHYDIREKIIK